MFWFEMPALVTTNTAADFLTYHQIYTIWGLPGSSVGRACDPCTKALSSLQQPGVGVRPVAICCMSPPLCLSSHCLSSLKLSCEYSHGKAKYQPHTHSWKLSRVLCKNICSVMLTNVETLQLQAVPPRATFWLNQPIKHEMWEDGSYHPPYHRKKKRNSSQ